MAWWDPSKKDESIPKMPHLKIVEACVETTREQNRLRRLIGTLTASSGWPFPIATAVL
jgi:hypothetical protein